MKNEKILREFIKRVINEDDGGGGGDYGFDIGMGSGGYGPGQGFIQDDHLKRIINAIWTDPKSALMGMGEDLFTNAKAVIGVLFESIMTTLIPFLDSEYDKIFKKRDDALNATEKKYGDAWKRTIESFKDSDLTILSFMANPGMFMTTSAFWKIPSRATAATKFITNGIIGDVAKSVMTASQEFANFVVGTKSSIAKPYRSFESVDRTINEKKSPSQLSNYMSAVKNFTNSNEFSEALESKHMQQVAQDSREIIKEYLNGIITMSNKAHQRVKSLQDIEGMLGQKEKESLSKLEGSERQQLEQQLVNAARKSITAYFKTKLSDELKSAYESGMPEGTDIEKMYKRAIAAIS